MSYIDIYSLRKRFDFLNFDSANGVKYDKEVFYNIKGYVSRAYDNNQKSDIKAFLSMFNRAVYSKIISFDDNEKIDLKEHTIAYMLQLACSEPIFASRCYRVIVSILQLIDDVDKKDRVIGLIKSKSDYIYIYNLCDAYYLFVGFWMYYNQNKTQGITKSNTKRELKGIFYKKYDKSLTLLGLIMLI